MKNKLTADEALRISKENNDDYIIENILAQVLESAKKGEFSLKIRSYGFGSTEYYTSEKNYPERGKKILKELRQLGYKATIKCEEKQFVDVYLYIEWKE